MCIRDRLVQARDAGKGVLLVSLELDEVMNVSDRILVMYEGEIVGEFDPKKVTCLLYTSLRTPGIVFLILPKCFMTIT